MLERQSPYLDRPGRLADLVAAIQALGSYRYAARKEEKWQQLLKKPKSAESWTEIFRDHPEFFRASESDSGMHQLVLRRAQSAMAHATTAESINIEAYKALSDDDKKEYSRAPLNPEQIISLIDVAIKLQNQAVARRQELRWWIPYLLSIASLVVGVVTGISIK